MHICIVCNEYPDSNHGGIGSFTKDLAEGLVQNRIEVSVIGIYSKYVLNIKEPIKETINGVYVEKYPFTEKFKDKRLNYFYNRYFLKKKIKELHKKSKINIIEVPEHDGWMPFSSFKNIPLVTRFHSSATLHGVLLNKGYSKLTSLFEKWQIKKSDYIISVSKFTADETLRIFRLEKKYKVIYNSVKIPNIKYKNQIDKNLILFTGSIVPRKGVTELVQSMPKVFRRYPNIVLKLAGKNLFKIDGEDYEDYLRKFIPNEFQKNIEFLGPLNREKELLPLIQKAKFCVFPSHVEAFSLAPIEAMALNKAVIFTKYVSGPELIEDGVSGLLADTKNPDDLAKKIIKLFENDALCKKIAIQGKKRVNKMFSYEKWIEENINFYKEVIDEK